MQRLSQPYIIGRDLIWKMELACFSTREPLATANCHIGAALFIFIIVISPAPRTTYRRTITPCKWRWLSLGYTYIHVVDTELNLIIFFFALPIYTTATFLETIS
jgi:hypothetical protein